MATVTYPNDQTSTYSYLDEEDDRRLQTIHHKYSNTSTLSKFDYTYDAVGNILTWRQQADTTTVLWKYGYDQSHQLTAAAKHATDTPQTVLERYAYAYDAAGNRTVEQIDDTITLAAYDNLNRLTNQAPGGPVVIAGSLNEAGTVTISGVPAVVSADNDFRGTVPTTTGTNTFTIVAKDASGNTTTRQYSVEVSGASRTFTFDPSGNLTSDGTRTFEWDAKNQMVAVNQGTHRSEFTYDGLQRRVRTVEKEGGAVQTDRVHIACSTAVCESRDAVSGVVQERFFTNGIENGTDKSYYARDHNDTVHEVTDEAGNRRGSYTYGPYGERTTVLSTRTTPVGFTGYHSHDSSGLALAPYRAYDPGLGRWINQDPIGIRGGINLFQYVFGNPIALTDPLGWEVQRCCAKAEILLGWVSHCWLKTQKNEAGLGNKGIVTCRGGGGMPGEAANASGGITTQVTDHTGCSTRNPRCEPVKNVSEPCVDRKIATAANGLGRRRGPWIPLLNDCQSFVNEVLHQCSTMPVPPMSVVMP